MDDKIKIAMATRASSTMFATMAGMPADVQLEAAILLLKALFMATVKKEHRLGMFSDVMRRVKKEIKEHLETGVVK